MNLKFDMKSVNEYTDFVPGKHRYYFDTLWDKGHVEENQYPDSMSPVSECKPGTES